MTDAYSAMTAFIRQLGSGQLSDYRVLEWGCPVPFFGDVSRARVATVGINPSNREFVDSSGHELQGEAQRLPTLSSLEADSWSQVDAEGVRTIVGACRDYFRGNPYDRWFGVLERVLARSSVSFYGHGGNACHLDLVPFATVEKWGELGSGRREALLAASEGAVGMLLADSNVSLLVLNGRSVVKQFESVASVSLEEMHMPSWDLPRSGTANVPGLAYSGWVSTFGGIDLREPVRVLGYNHNLQSSFGVTSNVVDEIGRWLANQADEL